MSLIWQLCELLPFSFHFSKIMLILIVYDTGCALSHSYPSKLKCFECSCPKHFRYFFFLLFENGNSHYLTAVALHKSWWTKWFNQKYDWECVFSSFFSVSLLPSLCSLSLCSISLSQLLLKSVLLAFIPAPTNLIETNETRYNFGNRKTDK